MLPVHWRRCSALGGFMHTMTAVACLCAQTLTPPVSWQLAFPKRIAQLACHSPLAAATLLLYGRH